MGRGFRNEATVARRAAGPHPRREPERLGIACEPSTPSIRAEKIAQHRRGVLAAAAVADGDDVAHLAQSLSAEAVAVARQMGESDHRAVMAEVATPDIPLECLQRRDSLARLDLFGDSIKLAKGSKGGLASALHDADPYEMASELARSDVSVGSCESTRSWKETDAMDSTNYGSSPESELEPPRDSWFRVQPRGALLHIYTPGGPTAL